MKIILCGIILFTVLYAVIYRFALSLWLSKCTENEYIYYCKLGRRPGWLAVMWGVQLLFLALSALAAVGLIITAVFM